MRHLAAILGLAVFAISAGSVEVATAQPPGGGFGGPGGPGGRGGMMGGMANNPLMLLANEKVRTELDIVDDQMADLESLQQEIREEMRDLFSGMRDASPDERQAAMEELRDRMKTYESRVQQILLPHQFKRLKQILVQSQSRGRPGAALMNNDDVKGELKITPEQESKLEEASQKAMEEMQAEIAKLQKKAEERVASVLTPEQQQKYRELVGEPFDFGQMFQFGGPGGPGGGRGQQGGPGGRGGRGGQGGNRSDF